MGDTSAMTWFFALFHVFINSYQSALENTGILLNEFKNSSWLEHNVYIILIHFGFSASANFIYCHICWFSNVKFQCYLMKFTHLKILHCRLVRPLLLTVRSLDPRIREWFPARFPFHQSDDMILPSMSHDFWFPDDFPMIFQWIPMIFQMISRWFPRILGQFLPDLLDLRFLGSAICPQLMGSLGIIAHWKLGTTK